MIITISGNHGSGKSTVAKILASQLSYERIYAGGIFRSMSKDIKHNPKNLPFEEWYASLAENPKLDLEVDQMIAEAAREKDNLILEGKVAFMASSHGKKKLDIFIAVDKKEGARRIFEQKIKNSSERGEEKIYYHIDQAIKEIEERLKVEKERYISLYGIDITDMNNYQFFIDSTNLTPEQVFERILDQIKQMT